MNKANKLRKNEDFQQVRKTGTSLSSAHVVVGWSQNTLEVSRFGIVAGKRVGGAVVRNKVKRRLRELIRVRISDIRAGRDIVLIARKSIETVSFQDLGKELDKLLHRAGLINIPDKAEKTLDAPSGPAQSTEAAQ